MPVLDTSGYEFHEPPISWGRIIIGLGDEEVTLQIGKMLREAFDAGIKKSANTGVDHNALSDRYGLATEQICKQISGCQDPVKILRCCPSATLAKFCRGSTPG